MMNHRGIIRPVGLYLAILFATSTSFAQITEKKDNLKTKIKDTLENQNDQSGYFGFHVGSPVNKYRSAPKQVELKSFDLTNTQMSLFQMKCSTMNIDFRAPELNLKLPKIENMIPLVSINQVEQIINKKALQKFFNTQLAQFEGLEQEWQPHLSQIQALINQNFNSIVDLPRLSQEILIYIQNNNLLGELTQDFNQLDQIDWSQFSFQDYINQNQLQNLLNNLSAQFNVSAISAQGFLNQSQIALDDGLHQSLTQTLSSLHQTGFIVQNNTLYFTNPTNANDRFSFSADLTNSNATCSFNTNGPNIQGTFAANAGNFISIQGGLNLNTNQVIASSQDRLRNSLNQIVGLLSQGINGDITLDQLLSQMQTLVQSIPSAQLPNLLHEIENNFDTDFSMTLNLQTLSNSFQGSGNYQFIDVILETLGHDVGTLTLNKKQIMDLSNMMINGHNQSEIGQYVLENVAGYKTDIIGYAVVRDVTNTFLSEHFSSNIIPVQQSIFGDGGMVQYGSSYYVAAKIKEWKSGSLIATGTYNQHSINNTPLLKNDGYLHLRSEIQSHAVGLAYLPKLWSFTPTRTRIDGIIQLEGLFVHAKSASILTKTDLTSKNSQDVVELYKIPLDEIDGAEKTYTVPMLSAGFNVQQVLTPGVAVNGFAIFYPGFKETGSLNEIPKSIGVKYATGFSFILNLDSNPKKPVSKTYHYRNNGF